MICSQWNVSRRNFHHLQRELYKLQLARRFVLALAITEAWRWSLPQPRYLTEDDSLLSPPLTLSLSVHIVVPQHHRHRLPLSYSQVRLPQLFSGSLSSINWIILDFLLWSCICNLLALSSTGPDIFIVFVFSVSSFLVASGSYQILYSMD